MAIRELVELAARVAELERRASGILRHGVVHEVDVERQRMRLDFGPAHGTEGRFISPWVPYAQHAGALKVYTPPSIGQQFTLASPTGDYAQAMAIPLTFSQQEPPPSDREDENVVTYGNVRITLRADYFEVRACDVIFRVGCDGITITNGFIRHDGRNIGSTHVHGGVEAGPDLTDVPAN
jgi:phage baseplate assembly protein gpV